MTDDLKEILQQYGLLSVTLSKLLSERPGTKYDSLEQYYESFGGIRPDEPVLVVRISKDGELRFLEEGEHDVVFEDKEGKKAGKTTVWEMPEDEFWYFQAFRPGLFDLDKDLPSFMYEMAITHAYAMFEGYVSEILRARLRQHPRLMGSQRQVRYDAIFNTSSREALMEEMVSREINELLYAPLIAILQKMRDEYGFKSLTTAYDEQTSRLSLLRNCLLHNRGRADAKLAKCPPAISEGDRISLTIKDVNEAVDVLRRFAYQIDRAFENTNANSL